MLRQVTAVPLDVRKGYASLNAIDNKLAAAPLDQRHNLKILFKIITERHSLSARRRA